MQAQAQNALLGPGDDITRLRELFGELFQQPAVLRHMSAMMAGSDVRYDLAADDPEAHPAVCCSTSVDRPG
jgi:hypothetical protein